MYCEHCKPVAVQVCVLHCSLSLRSTGHAIPGSMAGCVTLRARVRRPPPHETEHAVHDDHVESTQSRAHGVMPHGLTSDSGGQSMADTVTLRVRVAVPPPHDAEHVVQADHSVTAHAHAPCEHTRDSVSSSHAAPPLADAVFTMRWRRWSPVPHACEHGLQFDQTLSTQSTAHAAGEHGSLSRSDGHAVPPHCASVVTVRWRARVPVPHVTEQLDHAAHCDTLQGTAQQLKPQLTVSFSDGHCAPPRSAACVTVRARAFVADAPQVIEHCDHSAHADT